MSSGFSLIISVVCSLGCCGLWLGIIGGLVYYFMVVKKKSDEGDEFESSSNEEADSEPVAEEAAPAAEEVSEESSTPDAPPAAPPPEPTPEPAVDSAEAATEDKPSPVAAPTPSGATIIAFDDDIPQAALEHPGPHGSLDPAAMGLIQFNEGFRQSTGSTWQTYQQSGFFRRSGANGSKHGTLLRGWA